MKLSSPTNLFTLLLCLVSLRLDAQHELDTLVNRFTVYRNSSLQEKVFIRTDREVYLTGETLWLSAVCVDGYLHRPIDASRITYVEILDRENRPVLQAKISLNFGFGKGSLFLPASIPSGNYTLRAYTRWMQNFSPEFYFKKTVAIINTFQKPDNNKVITLSFKAQFFPEGGNLIEGLQNKVAFQVTDPSGSGIDCSGFVINEHNDTLAKIRPLSFGIGSFSFMPVTGKHYRAVISDGKGKSNTYALPKALTTGYVLHLEEDDKEVRLNIRHSEPSAKYAYIFIHARQRVTLAQRIHFNNGEALLNIQKSEFLDGISHITLFNEDFQPVCERLYYNENGPLLSISSGTVETVYGPRRKVTIDLTTSGPGSDVAHLTVSVSRKDSLSGESPSLSSYLWLTSDLQGRIESPEFYVEPRNPGIREALDNLMLTHGWRRFKWTDVTNGKKPDYSLVPESRSHLMAGRVKDTGGLLVPGVETFLSVPGKSWQFRTSRSNAKGEILFELPDLFGTRQIIAQPDPRSDTLSRIELLSPFSNQFHAETIPPLHLSSGLENILISRSIGMQVQDIFPQAQPDKPAEPVIDSVAFYGKPDEVYFLDQYTRFPVMEEVMREYVSGVFVRERKGKFQFMVLDHVNKNVMREDPLILLDGYPIFNADQITSFNPLLVKKLEVITRKYYMGYATFPGIVSYRTYSGDLAGFQPDTRSTVLDYEGMQFQREFYSPVYQDDSQRTSRLPDRRNLLYWAPNLYTGKDGKLRIEFYTSDVRGEYSATIEGITGKGAVGRHTVSFKVK